MTSCFKHGPYIKAYILIAFMLFQTISQFPNAIADDDKNLTAAEHLQKAKELHKAFEKALWSGSWDAEKERATKDKIRYYFKEAAAKGNGEAFYELARRTTDTSQQINLYSEAIRAGFRKGDNPALKKVLDKLLFDPRDPTLVDPKMGLALHDLAVKNGSSPIESSKLQALVRAAEAPSFDIASFFEQIGEELSTGPYEMWWVVEKFSNGKYPIDPTPELMFQLVISLDGAPNYKKFMINDYYKAWVGQDLRSFDACEYDDSNLLMQICGSRKAEKAKLKQKNEMLSGISSQFSNNKQLMESADEAYQATLSFIEKTAWTESLYEGSLYWSFVQRDIENRLTAYKVLLSRIAEGAIKNQGPKGVEFDETISLEEFISLIELNEEQGISLLESCSGEMISTGRMSISKSELIENQVAWRLFSEASSGLFTVLNDEYDQGYWERYLASNRVRDLEQLNVRLLELFEDHGC